MTLTKAAPLFGIPVSSLSDLERGAANVSRETIARVEGVTAGQVTANDIQATYRRAHRVEFAHHREAGRAAMASYRKTAKKPRKSGD